MNKKLLIGIASAVVSAVIAYYVNEVIKDVAESIDVDKKNFNFEMDGVNNDL